MVRICLIPVFVVVLLAPWAARFWDAPAAANVQAVTATAVFALISLTDSLDGYLARSRNEVTVFGKFMDPIADKVLVVAALVALVELGSVPSWIPLVIIARELLVSGLRMLVASAGVVVAASWIGKAKTATTMVAICCFILVGAPLLDAAQPWFGWLSWTLMIAAVILTVVSMVDYFAKSWPLLTETPSDRGAGEAVRTVERDAGVDANAACGTQERASLEGEFPRARSVIEAASAAGVTVGTAESCTGGLVAGALTSVAGSSAVVSGGIVSYMVPVKEAVLDVAPDTIEGYGVVSEETAKSMAIGARARLGCAYAVSTTGVAGPGGGSEETPVGTVCFAVAGPSEARCERLVFPGARDEVRAQAVDHALALLIAAIDDDCKAGR